MTCREGLGTRFHPGEVLVSECRVDWSGTGGWSMVVGGDSRRALVGAVLDAGMRMDPAPPALAALRAALEESRRDLSHRRAEESRLAASTRVEFDLMPGA